MWQPVDAAVGAGRHDQRAGPSGASDGLRQRIGAGWITRAEAKVHHRQSVRDSPVDGRHECLHRRVEGAVEDLERTDMNGGREILDGRSDSRTVAQPVDDVVVGARVTVEAGAPGRDRADVRVVGVDAAVDDSDDERLHWIR